MIGIYRIKNKINGHCYYGSSKNIRKRLKQHKNQLKKNKHINIILQRAFNKYGFKNFIFEVVEECELDMLLETEQNYLDKNPVYNIGKGASGGDNLSNHPHREEIIRNIKTTLVEKRKDLTIEERKERWSRPGEENPNWKGGVSKKQCPICGIKIKPSNKNCIKCYDKSGDKNPFYGKKHSDETKKKFSEMRKGKYNGNQNNPIVVNGVEYSSAGEASKHLNIPSITIRHRVLSKNPKFKDYNYKGQVKEVYTEDEMKKRYSDPQKGKKTNKNRPFLIDGVEYRTLQEASEKLKTHQMTIKGRLLSDNFVNYVYKDKL